MKQPPRAKKSQAKRSAISVKLAVERDSKNMQLQGMPPPTLTSKAHIPCTLWVSIVDPTGPNIGSPIIEYNINFPSLQLLL